MIDPTALATALAGGRKQVASDASAALGFAPHSGWAALVGIGLDGGQPRVLARERFEMTEPRDPASKQPYHAVEELDVALARKRLDAWEAKAAQLAGNGISGVVAELGKKGHRVVGIGILESAGRKGSSLLATLASHALIHTADGDHFRNALAAAATERRLAVARIRAHDLDAEAAAAIGRPSQALRDTVHSLGREVGSPWTADQKAAALLAWLVLARGAAEPRRART